MCCSLEACTWADGNLVVIGCGADRGAMTSNDTPRAPHPYVGTWVTSDGFIRQELLPNGRYDEARGSRRSAYTGSYTVTGSHIDYVDDTGFTATGDVRDGVLTRRPSTRTRKLLSPSERWIRSTTHLCPSFVTAHRPILSTDPCRRHDLSGSRSVGAYGRDRRRTRPSKTAHGPVPVAESGR